MDRNEQPASTDPHEAPDETGARAWDGVLREAFGQAQPDWAEESVVAAIGRVHDASAAVLLRDAPGTHSPVIRVLPAEQSEAASDARYQIIGEIARGGIGVVYKARDRDIGRDVAIKVMLADKAARPGLTERFVEEAQVAAQLQHPGIVPVYGMGLQADGRPHFAMQLIKGSTLAAVLDERTDPSVERRRLLGIFEQICHAIGYAHAKGVVHRDLKPANVMIGAFGEVLVVDWGLAKVLGRKDAQQVVESPASIVATVRSDGDAAQSVAGSVMGTLSYMPPEQALGRVSDIDERSDVFALGAILTEILTGEPPYIGEAYAVLHMAMRGVQDDAHARLGGCDAAPELVDLAKRCMSPLRADRPRNAVAVAHAIAAHLEQAEVRAHKARVAAANAVAVEAEHRALVARDRLSTAREQAALEEARRRHTAEEMRRKREHRRAGFERRVRRLSLATAAVVLLGAGGTGWFRHARDAAASEHRRAQEASVAQALREAVRVEGEGRRAEALALADGAVKIAAGAPAAQRASAAAVAERIRAEQHAAEQAEEQSRQDRELIARAEEFHIRFTDRASTRYLLLEPLERFLASAGVDLDETDAAAVAQAVGARSPAVTESLSDLLWVLATQLPRGGDRREHVLDVLNAIDPDPFCIDLRRALSDADGEGLQALTASEEFALQSYSVRRQAVDWLTRADAYLLTPPDRESAGQILASLERERPDDVIVRTSLAGLAVEGATRNFGDALRHATASAVLRPRSAFPRGALAGYEGYYGDPLLADRLRGDVVALAGDVFSRANLRMAGFKDVIPGSPSAAELNALLEGASEPAAAALRAQWAVWTAETSPTSPASPETLELAKRAHDLAPDSWLTHVLLASSTFPVLGAEETLRVTRDALARWPNHGRLLLMHGAALEMLGYSDSAIGAYERGLSPHAPFAVCVLWNLRSTATDAESSLAEWRAVADRLRLHAPDHGRVAQLYREIGDDARAEHHLQWARELSKDDPVAVMHVLAEDAAARQDHPGTESWCRQALAALATGSRRFTFGWEVMQQASQVWREARLELMLGVALLETGRPDEAESHLRRAVDGPLVLRFYDRHVARLALLECGWAIDAMARGEDARAGTAVSGSASEAVGLALLCVDDEHAGAAADHYHRALTLNNALDVDGHLGVEAVAASLRAAGADGTLTDARRTELRRRALQQARHTLSVMRRMLASENEPERCVARSRLRAWTTDRRVAPVRDEGALGLLPRAEADAWRVLWAEAEAALQDAYWRKP